MKPLPFWSLSKTPETGAYVLSSPSRTTSLLISKKSDGRIAYDSREKEDTLSLKCENKPSASPFSFLHTFGLLLCFIFPFAFLFFFSILFSSSFIFSQFLPIFSFLFAFLSPLLEHYTYETKGGNFLPSFLKPNEWLPIFHPIFLYFKFLFMTS